MKQKSVSLGKYGLQISYVLMLTFVIPIILVRLIWIGLQADNLNANINESFFLRDILLVLVYFLVIFILGLLNMIQSFRACYKKEITYCINRMLILKYGMVLFFIINFAVITLMLAGGGLISLIASHGTIVLALPIILPILLLLIVPLVFGTWLLMLPGAFYGVQVIRHSYSEKKLGMGAALMHGFFQFCFLIDVLDAMYLSVKKWGIGRKSAVLIGILYAAAALAVIWLIVKL